MEHITDIIKNRKSVRTFNGKEISFAEIEKLKVFIETIENPYKIPVEFKLLNAKENGLICPVVTGTDLYIGGKIKSTPEANVAFGYSFEMLVLYAQSLGIGTVWLGGTMNRSAFEKAMNLGADEIMPCASPIGYPAKKMSLKESMMRKVIKADERLNFQELFFKDNFDTPLTKDQADNLLYPLEMVRLAPSAVNRQPWRIIVSDNYVHFYLKRSKGFATAALDMQKIDIGIALCHFALAANEIGLNAAFTFKNPKITVGADTEYIASYLIK